MFKNLLANKAYQFLSAAVRNALIAGGAWLTGAGYASEAEAASLVTAGMLAFGVLWSFARKQWPNLKL